MESTNNATNSAELFNVSRVNVARLMLVLQSQVKPSLETMILVGRHARLKNRRIVKRVWKQSKTVRRGQIWI